MKQSDTYSVAAVVVTFQPDLEVLGLLIDALVAQVESIIVVDNGSHEDLDAWHNQRQTPAVKLLLLGENKGIAAAHNVGILWAQNKGADFALLMDQDSIPAPDMVEKLLSAFLAVKNNCGAQPIAAGPICMDTRSNKKSFFVTEQYGFPWRWRDDTPLEDENFSIEVSALISSGSLIDLKAFQAVGGMRSNYFIDHVDTEWCFRARAKGYVLLGVPKALMKHTLGDKIANIWFFGWRHVAYHSPLRDYYMFRNTLLMFHDVEMSFFMRLYLLWRLLKFIVYFLIFAPQRLQRFYFMTLGICHGVRGIGGKIDLKTGQCTQIQKSDLDP